jgi:Putative Ig domain
VEIAEEAYLSTPPTAPVSVALAAHYHGQPLGITVNSSTGVIAGTLADNADVNGPYAVTATVTDGGSLSATQVFEWDIDAVLVPDGVADQQNVGGDTVSLALTAEDVNPSAVASLFEK